MEIYAVENDIENLLLVDGNYVVNGSYKLIFHRNGSAGNHVNDIKAYHVMTVPKSWLKGKWDDSEGISSYKLLNKAEKTLRKLKAVV